MTALELRLICSAGGNIVIDATQFSFLDIRMLASAANTGSGHVIIKNAQKLSAMDCRLIATNGGKRTVTFDFTE